MLRYLVRTSILMTATGASNSYDSIVTSTKIRTMDSTMTIRSTMTMIMTE